jgi:hypothetical protein
LLLPVIAVLAKLSAQLNPWKKWSGSAYRSDCLSTPARIRNSHDRLLAELPKDGKSQWIAADSTFVRGS